MMILQPAPRPPPPAARRLQRGSSKQSQTLRHLPDPSTSTSLRQIQHQPPTPRSIDLALFLLRMMTVCPMIFSDVVKALAKPPPSP